MIFSFKILTLMTLGGCIILQACSDNDNIVSIPGDNVPNDDHAQEQQPSEDIECPDIADEGACRQFRSESEWPSFKSNYLPGYYITLCTPESVKHNALDPVFRVLDCTPEGRKHQLIEGKTCDPEKDASFPSGCSPDDIAVTEIAKCQKYVDGNSYYFNAYPVPCPNGSVCYDARCMHIGEECNKESIFSIHCAGNNAVTCSGDNIIYSSVKGNPAFQKDRLFSVKCPSGSVCQEGTCFPQTACETEDVISRLCFSHNDTYYKTICTKTEHGLAERASNYPDGRIEHTEICVDNQVKDIGETCDPSFVNYCEGNYAVNCNDHRISIQNCSKNYGACVVDTTGRAKCLSPCTVNGEIQTACNSKNDAEITIECKPVQTELYTNLVWHEVSTRPCQCANGQCITK